MAKPDEIRTAAKKSLEIYKSAPTYLWCKLQVRRIPEKILNKTVIPNIMGYVSGLEAYIKKDDLVSMRRHQNPERYIESFERCKEEIEKILPQIELNQVTEDIFSSLMDEDDELDAEEDAGTVSPRQYDSPIWRTYRQLKKAFPEREICRRRPWVAFKGGVRPARRAEYPRDGSFAICLRRHAGQPVSAPQYKEGVRILYGHARQQYVYRLV